MAKPIRKRIFLIVLFIVLVLNTAASASIIDLYAPTGSVPVEFIAGTSIEVNAQARGLGSYLYFIYDFEPDADFHLFASYDGEGFYQGSLSIISPEEADIGTLFSASFSKLKVTSSNFFGVSTISFSVKDLFKTGGLLDVATVEGEGLRASGSQSNQMAFIGQIKGVTMPQERPMEAAPVPEPATAMMLALGLIGLAGLGRREK